MSRTIVTLAFLGATLGLGVTLPAHAVDGVSDDTVTIGAFGPITGPAAFIGLGGRDGMNLAAKEVNAAGGIHGRRLRILFEDDAHSPSRALAAVKKLVDQDRVFMIFSVAGSNSTVGVIDFVKERQVPMYVSIASAPQVTQPFSKYLFRGGTTEAARYGEIYSEFLTQGLGARRIGFISGRDEFSKNEADAVIRYLRSWFNQEPVKRVEFNIGDKDFTPQLLELKQANPDVIMISGHPAEGAIILRQARELGLNQKFFGSGTMVDNSIPANAKSAAEGFMAAWLTPLYFGSRHPDMVKFETAWRREYPNMPAGRPNVFDLLGYGDLHVVAEGLRRAGPDLTRDKFIAALETLRNWRVSMVATPRTFTPEHHIGNLSLQIMEVKNGEWTPLAWESKRPSDILKHLKK
ncbi:MAG TPA: ABC transporter substrate-binding protein [candidate division Zixibacteria bacterium]|nr:ABC transporter substrate-binding protein [candidate division Zixibacteria bacterium]